MACESRAYNCDSEIDVWRVRQLHGGQWWSAALAAAARGGQRLYLWSSMSGTEEQEGPAEWADMKSPRTTVSREQAHKNHDSNTSEISTFPAPTPYAHCEK